LAGLKVKRRKRISVQPGAVPPASRPDDQRQWLEDLRHDYNHRRHVSLGRLTPNEFATMRSSKPAEAASRTSSSVRTTCPRKTG